VKKGIIIMFNSDTSSDCSALVHLYEVDLHYLDEHKTEVPTTTNSSLTPTDGFIFALISKEDNSIFAQLPSFFAKTKKDKQAKKKEQELEDDTVKLVKRTINTYSSKCLFREMKKSIVDGFVSKVYRYTIIAEADA